jgi:hypothetical protein
MILKAIKKELTIFQTIHFLLIIFDLNQMLHLIFKHDFNKINPLFHFP